MAAPYVSSSEMNGIETSFDRLSIASEDSAVSGRLENDFPEDSFEKDWGFRLSSLFKLAVQFFKEKDGKAVHLSYEDKLKLVAYTQQVAHGPFNSSMLPPLGYLDVIGKDRRQAWQGIGNISREDGMREFVKLLESKCPQLKPYIEAHKRDLEEKEKRKKAIEEEKRAEEQRQKQEEDERRKEEEEREKQELQKRQIKEALNQQTFHQFKSYAEQQYPGNPEQQGVLIRQLQEEHYEKYMQQLYQRQQILAEQHEQQSQLVNGDCEALGHPILGDNQIDTSSGEEDDEDVPQVNQAAIWTRKDIKDFKDSIRKEGGDSIIKVGHGETVTVRVPTHADGTFLFWEFATDSYDIGFGLFFEWSQSSTTQVSVHISDSEEEFEDDEELESEDVERGSSQKPSEASDRPSCSVIVPVYRRDCHEEVYAGSHHYPGQGVYLLKFDNSYSLWRSKTLYYRVYYTR